MALHEMIKPLEWMLGKWRAEGGGRGQYPTISDFQYGEEVEFFHVGQPVLQYSMYSWNVETKKPMHREVGFIRIQPGTNKVVFISAHNFGVAGIEEGEVKENELRVETKATCRMFFAKDPEVTKVRHTFRRNGNKLEHIMEMETSSTALTEHLRITHKKVD